MIIEGIEHHKNKFKQQGKTLKFIDGHSLWMIVLILFGSLIIEMLVFACLYTVMSLSSIKAGLDDSTTGTLRLRVAKISKFDLTNAHVIANFRIYVPESNRHANAKLQLKTDDLFFFGKYSVWNIATKPFRPETDNDIQLDINRYDGDRVYEFIPDLLNERYRSDNEKVGRKIDYRNLDVVITIKSPLFGTDWVYPKSFTAKDFVCGKLISIEDHSSGKIVMDWSGWGKYEDYIEKTIVKSVILRDIVASLIRMRGRKQ